VKPVSLLRLYPARWRARYGAEMLALLESTPSSPGRTRDIIRAAAWEWIRWTPVGRVLFAAIGALVSTTLAQLISLVAPIDRPLSLESAWLWVLGGLLPHLVAVVLLVDAARIGKRLQRFGFRMQLSVLAVSATLATWMGAGHSHIPSPWLSNAAYYLFYLILLFNMERSVLMSKHRFPIEP
jgi:hypothetical protein